MITLKFFKTVHLITFNNSNKHTFFDTAKTILKQRSNTKTQVNKKS